MFMLGISAWSSLRKSEVTDILGLLMGSHPFIRIRLSLNAANWKLEGVTHIVYWLSYSLSHFQYTGATEVRQPTNSIVTVRTHTIL